MARFGYSKRLQRCLICSDLAMMNGDFILLNGGVINGKNRRFYEAVENISRC